MLNAIPLRPLTDNELRIVKQFPNVFTLGVSLVLWMPPQPLQKGASNGR
jgi:hypothetical protein